MAAAEALDLMDTFQGVGSAEMVTGIRVRLGRHVTLGSMVAVVAQFREAMLGGCVFEIEIDATRNERMSEGAQILLRELVARAQREQIQVRFSGRLDATNRLTLLR